MGSGFSKMKKQARALEEQYSKMREEMANAEFVGESGGGLVRVVLNGEKELKSVKIRPDCVDPSDVEGLEDLIYAAFGQAAAKVRASHEQASPGNALPGNALPGGMFG